MSHNSTVSDEGRLQPSDYASISDENTGRYGTDINRIGPMLLSERYDDRTHFVYELLQNAEDALGRRSAWDGSRTVSFKLTESKLDVRHYGDPFNEDDVRGVCGIAEGNKKEENSIGRFGIGFKSVYAFTDRPEIHSGAEDFAIERYVHPYPVTPIEREPDETVILLPLRDSDGYEEIATGFSRLDAKSLLFLREIEKIQWKTADGQAGEYHRKSTNTSKFVRRVTISEQHEVQDKVIEDWLVFSQAVSDQHVVGYIEIAFQMIQDENRYEISQVDESPLVVYFPTVKETHLGFLAQGPYRTTPSRDNVPFGNAWNKHCIEQTARLLVSALSFLRDKNRLNVGVLETLPLNVANFGERSMFKVLFQETKKTLTEQPLLPCFGGGYTSARHAKIARTEELRNLFDKSTLANFCGLDGELNWVSADVSRDRTYELWDYLQDELGIEELTPRTILSRLDVAFLEARPDEWICRLYEFLNQQQALHSLAKNVPLIRLEDGKHVQADANGEPLAFLPGKIETSFPTVRASVCNTDRAKEFLRSIGLDEPSPVDDVLVNVLPKYHLDVIEVGDSEYESDFRRIVNAYSKGSSQQRETLVTRLRNTKFVKVKDSLDSSGSYQKPDTVYIATDRLKSLFNGVSQAFLVDEGFQCLRGENTRKLLEACGAVQHMRPILDESLLPLNERKKLREQGGEPRVGRFQTSQDWTLHGLEDLLNTQQYVSVEECRTRSKLIWEEISYLADRRREVFTGKYSWSYYGNYNQFFDSAFLKLLNSSEWIPDPEGELQRPEFIDFDTLDWKPNQFVQEKIKFRPSVIDQFAKETGIDPRVVDLLKKLGITSKEELAIRLGLENETELTDESNAEDDKINQVSEGQRSTAQQTTSSTNAPFVKSTIPGNRSEMSSRSNRHDYRGNKSSKQESSGERTFISYVAVHANDVETDPDGLGQSSRMAIENKAIGFILEREPDWNRTPEYNPGYDLYKADLDKQPIVLCEVKAMTQSLAERPVGMTRTQFEYARKYGENYWLYIVEHTNGEVPRIVRINNPAGKARTYTFDRGWKDVAHED